MDDNINKAASITLTPDREQVQSKSPDQEDLLQLSYQIARRVLPFLAERGIPVSPANYRLWYDYFTSGSEELKTTLDQYINDDVEFTPDLSQHLFERFFSYEAAEKHLRLLDEAGEKVQTVALGVIKQLLISMTQSSHYRNSLGGHIEDIKKASKLEDLIGIVRTIIEETGVVIEAHGILHRKMEETSQELSKLHEELRRRDEMAHTDELTRLCNRRAFNIRLADEIARARRYGTSLSLILFDLDDFKIVNDTFGHLIGDRLLTVISVCIKENIREADVAARYGGEEFAVICPETEIPGAAMVAERLRAAIDCTDFTLKGDQVRATISAGVSKFKSDETMEDLINRADQCLYLAKQRGKNMICTETDLG